MIVNEPAAALWDLLWEIGDSLMGISSQLEGVAKETGNITPGHQGELMFCSGKIQGLSMCLKAAAGEQAAIRHGG